MRTSILLSMLLFTFSGNAEPVNGQSETFHQCSMDEVNLRMPGVVFDYLRLSAALEQGALTEFILISSELNEKTEPFSATPLRAPTATMSDCRQLGQNINKASHNLLKVRSLGEAKKSMSTFGQLIALWGFYNQTRADKDLYPL